MRTSLLLVLGCCIGLVIGVVLGITVRPPLPSSVRGSPPTAFSPQGIEPNEYYVESAAGIGSVTNARTLEKLRAQIATLDEENRVLNERNRELDLEIRRLEQQLARRETERVPVVSHTPASETNVPIRRRVWRQPLDLTRGMSKETATELGLSDEQLSAVNTVLQRTSDKLRTLERANAEVKYVSDDLVVIKVKSFPEDGAATKQALLDELRTVLPEEQYRRLEESLATGPATFLPDFGQNSREITIRTTQTEDGKKRYQITEIAGTDTTGPGLVAPAVSMGFGTASGADSSGITIQAEGAESGTGTRSMRMKTMFTSEIPSEYRHFLEPATN
ncbi:MAG: hypothetical protein ACUVWX_11925 [Kiritimatiellia bacterium]